MLSGVFSVTDFYILNGSDKTYLKEIWALRRAMNFPELMLEKNGRKPKTLQREVKFSRMGVTTV